jgi:transcriptional regulator with PAS, ATPase and Fis domain
MADPEFKDRSPTLTEERPLPWTVNRVRPFLIVIGSARDGGAAKGEKLVPFEGAVEIGRNPEPADGIRACTLADARASGRHARIRCLRAGGFEIADLGSKNGTLVEGRPVDGPVKLTGGSMVSVGGHLLLVCNLSQEQVDAILEDVAAPFGPVATVSGAMAIELRRLRRLAATKQEVLLSGETGVGKEVYARALHAHSRRPGRFVALNCAALPTELVESELFGYARGAHSQAAASKPGLLEAADGGTLFLDEIGDMPAEAQAKLLRFLQEHEYTALGSRETRRLDVRIVAATSSLGKTSQAPGLRQDLLGRLGASPVVLPPLRARREDIGALVHHFSGGQPIEKAVFLALCLHDWPQNVRELEKVILEARHFAAGEPEICMDHLPHALRSRIPTDVAPLVTRRRSPRGQLQRSELEALLQQHKGNVAEVARSLDRQWAVVWRAMQKAGLSADKYR